MSPALLYKQTRPPFGVLLRVKMTLIVMGWGAAAIPEMVAVVIFPNGVFASRLALGANAEMAAAVKVVATVPRDRGAPTGEYA